jgi:hypothetical protein
MKSHAMKARAEAEAHQQTPSIQKPLIGHRESMFQSFKSPKPEVTSTSSDNGNRVTSPSNSGIGSIGPLNLSSINSSAAMAAALSRIQQQQQLVATAATALGASAQPIFQLQSMLQQRYNSNNGTVPNDWLTNQQTQFILPGNQ